MIDKNYFLSRLDAGEDIDEIGKEMASMMNEALADYKKKKEEEAKKKALEEQENAKRELMEELVGIIKELAILEGVDAADVALTKEDFDFLVQSMHKMFAAFAMLKDKASDKDEDVLRRFVSVY